MVEGTFGLTVSIAERIATRPGRREALGKIDGVLNDVDLVLQRRRDVDRRIRDDERGVVAGNVHDEAVADPASGAQAPLASTTAPISSSVCRLPFIRASACPEPHEFDSRLCRLMAVRSLDEPHA